MPVYRRHRLVHIHIPKTAGTAVERLFHQLDDMVWGARSWLGEAERNGRWYEYQHLTAIEFRELTAGEFDDFARFAIVRDPYQRLISDYLWRRAIKQGNPHAFVPSFDTFDEFVAAIPEGVDDAWDDLIMGADRAGANLLIHLRPQYHYLHRPAGHTEPAIEIVAFEALPHDLDRVLARHGVQNHVVRATHAHRVDEYFTADTLDLVNDRYREDFVRLGYPMLERPGP